MRLGTLHLLNIEGDSNMNRLLLLALAFSLFTIGAAHAQDASSGAASDEEARARFESGRLAFEAGRYEEALSDFRRSYELSGRGLILFNVGLVEDRLRHDEAAVEAFEQYLAAVPDAENRAEVEARIRVLHQAIDARALDASPSPSPADVPATPTPAAETSASSPAPGPGAQDLYEIGGLTALGLALAAGAGAGATWALANDRYAALDASCGSQGCSTAQIAGSGAPDLVTATNVLLVSAIVAGLASAAAWTLYLVDVPTAQGTSLRLGPGTLRITF